MTVRELIAAYQQHCIAAGVHSDAANTFRKPVFNLFCAAYGDLPAADAKPFMLSEFIASHDGWKSMATKRGVASAIKAVWNWAIDEERLDGRNPFRRVRYADADPRPAFPDEEFHDLCAVADKRYERALRFLRMVGCRLTELCELTWKDGVDLERGTVTFLRHKSLRYTHRPKTIPLVPTAVELLKSIKERQPAGYDGVVFLNNRDKPWTRRTLGQNLMRMKKRYGITTPASLHGLRHAFAQTAANAGAPMKLLSLHMGHASSSFTEARYAGTGYAIENIRAAAALGQAAPPDA